MLIWQLPCSSGSCLPVVITGRGQNDEDRFAAILQYIVLRYHKHQVQVLHPAFLIDYLSLDYTGRVYGTGRAGAGNSLAHLSVKAIVAPKKIILGKKEQLFSKLACEHHALTKKTLQDYYYARKTRTYDDSYSVLSVISHTADTSLTVYGFTIRNIFQNVVHSHRSPKQNMGYYQNLNYTPICYMRHPLDTLISNISKLNIPLLQRISKVDHNQSGSGGLKQLFVYRSLANLAYFEQLATALAEYMQALLAGPQIFMVRYEKMITAPIATLQDIAQHIGCELDEPAAAAIWKQYGFKPLFASNPSHLNAPSADKYKQYLRQEHYDILARLGYPELVLELGYEYDPQPAPTSPLAEMASTIESPTLDQYFGEASQFHQNVWPQYQDISRKNVIRSLPLTDTIRIATNSIEKLNLTRELLASPYHHALFTSLPAIEYLSSAT